MLRKPNLSRDRNRSRASHVRIPHISIGKKMMISRTGKYICTFFLALALVALPSCMRAETTTGTQLAAATELRLGIPIDCDLGKDCFVILYPDRDPGPEAVDFGCGRQTYDTHKGTDFAIPDNRAMARGVPVIASAPGTVLRVRDGIADRRIRNDADKQAVDNIECGNGLVIDHGGGWETQYCHLRNGSVAVTQGTKVETGTVLGMVGNSGLASFPHVHLSVRYQGAVVDPFVGANAGPGCQVDRHPIWKDNLTYIPTGLIRAGFSPEAPTMDALWDGSYSDSSFNKDIPQILFWIQAYGVLKRDEIKFRLTAPNGEVVAESQQPIANPSRSWMGYVGKRNTFDRPIIPGTWLGEYQLVRNGSTIIEVSRTIEIR